MEVGHHPVHPRRRKFQTAHLLAGLLVVGVQHRRPGHSLGGEQQVAADHQDRPALPADPGEVHAFERRVVLDPVVRLAHRLPPEVLAGVHVDRGDPAVRRLVDRQPLRARNADGAEVHPVGNGFADGRALAARRSAVVLRSVGVHARLHHAAGTGRPGGLVEDPGGRVERRRVGDVHAGGAPAGDPPLVLVIPLRDGRHVRPADPVLAGDFERLFVEFRGIGDQVLRGEVERLERFGNRGPGLGFGEFLAGHDGLRGFPFLDRPDRLAGVPVEGEGEPLFRGLDRHRHGLAVHGHIRQDRDIGEVVVPDGVVRRLEVPDPFAGVGVERDDAGAEQVVPGAEPAVEVDRRRVRRDVHDPAVEVGGERRPRRHIPGPPPGVVFPGVHPELLFGAGNHMELPLVLAGLRVVAQDVAGDVLDAGLVVALRVRVADDHGPVHHDGRRGTGDVADRRRKPLVGVVVVAEVGEQVHDAGLRETGKVHRFPETLEVVAGEAVEGVEEERRADHIDDQAAVHHGVPHALAVTGAHGFFPPARRGFAVGPDRFAGRRIHGDHRPPVADDGVEQSADVTRRGLGEETGLRPVVVAAPHPGDFEVLEVPRVHLVERRGARAPGVAALVPPLAFRVAPVLGGRGRRERAGGQSEEEERRGGGGEGPPGGRPDREQHRGDRHREGPLSRGPPASPAEGGGGRRARNPTARRPGGAVRLTAGRGTGSSSRPSSGRPLPARPPPRKTAGRGRGRSGR